MDIDMVSIEKKWQERWEKEGIFKSVEDPSKKKYYVLEMYPYPSASFLHMGHVRNYTIGDVFARFKRMCGFNVLYPMGYDSFGLPAEIAAKKEGIHPRKYTEDAIRKIMEYQKGLGNSYDWARTISSHDPSYYKWNQYFFLKLFERGLAYRKKAPVNWCEPCGSVLANEESEGGKCWRCGSEVVKKELEQWFFRITDYAERLLLDLEKIEWPVKIKTMQRNWIGKSPGVEINFSINGKDWPIFTTRPDTIYGVTFMVISAQHRKLSEITTPENKKEMEEFVKRCGRARTKEEMESLDKDGVFTGSYAVNPLTLENIPVYAGNFVVADYGSGMVMAVPAHDQRDFEFSKKYNLPIKVVIQPENGIVDAGEMNEAFTDGGRLVNSDIFNGMNNTWAMEKITEHLENSGKGKRTFQYKIRDWLISRQRYWGTPIPVIYCEKCGAVPVPEKDLPVLLPDDVDFKSNLNPLSSSRQFMNASCPKCGEIGKRETDTMGGFVDSSWYFLRYCDSKNNEEPFSKGLVNYWMPVDQYVGGAEHAVMHLIYARFFVKALRDMGFVDFDEPFSKLFNQGIVYKDGAKMSKSKGNVVFQTDISGKYGIDTARLFLMFVSSPDKEMEWTDDGIEGSYRIIGKLARLKEKIIEGGNARHAHKINATIKKVSESIPLFEYPKAIIALTDAIDYFSEGISKSDYETLLKLMSPFCPHICEELWHDIGNKDFISISSWPQIDESKISPEIEKREQEIGKTIEDIRNISRIMKEKQGKEGKTAYLYLIPKEVEIYTEFSMHISRMLGMEIRIFASNDSAKHDPQGKASKAKPGKPAIYIE